MISEAQVRKYCYENIENIENYDKAVADTEHIWHCHHKVETIMNCGRKELKAKGCYYHRPAHDLIFLTRVEHTSLHSKSKRMPLAARKRISSRLKGREISEIWRKRLSISHLGKLVNSPSLSKSVKMFRMSDGKELSFPSQCEAARWLRENGYPNANVSKVSECANGHRATAYGAKWSYLDSSSI